MTTGDFFQNMKLKVHNAYNNFFYSGEEAPAPAPMQQEPDDAAPSGFVQQSAGYQQPQMNYQQPAGYQQPQMNYQQPAGYQQPQMNYQQPAGYQQPQAGGQRPFAAPQVDLTRQAGRTRRAAQHASGNVVDFDRYQAQQPFAAQQPVQAQPQEASASGQNAWVINVRGMNDCCSAITLLREGGAVLAVLENITDPTEMRRLVDTLSGACYSLTATITKLSRNGVYLLAPQAVTVYTDQATKTMNSAGSRSYSYQQQATPRQGMGATAPLQNEEPAVFRQQGFARQTARPAASPSFYARPVPQDAAIPDFSTVQSAGSGYRPDDLAVGGY